MAGNAGGKRLEISLFGACIVRSPDEGGFEITGTKHRAFFALLATAPFGRRTRTFLQDMLWSVASYDGGRQSLRRALSDIKQILGDDFPKLITTNNSEVTLDLSKVWFIGQPGRGEFLEGLDIREEGFNDWLRSMRANPEQLRSLFSTSPRPVATLPVPAITILPFQLVTGDTSDRVLGDWLAEEICRSLSRSNLLAVISHLSSRALAGRSVEIGAVRRQLQVDYCVAGTIRALRDDLVINADFIDASSGRIIWTREFMVSVNDILERYSRGIAEIVSSVGRSIADDAITYVRDRQVDDIRDHRLLVAGVSLMHQRTKRAFERSRQMIEEAVKRSPTSAEVHAWQGNWYILSVFNGWSTDPAGDTQAAIDCTARALDIDPENAFCLSIDGFAHNNLLQRLDVAEKRYDSALDLNPNDSLSWLLKGALHAFRDEAEHAIAATDTARRLSPIDPFGYFYDTLSATAHLSGSNYEEALKFAEQSIRKNDRHLSTLRVKISALHHLGRAEEARSTAVDLLRRQPNFTVSDYLKNHPANRSKTGQAVAEALRASGIS